MDRLKRTEHPTRGRAWLLVGGLLIVLAAAVALWYAWWRHRPIDDTSPFSETPWRNARPGVRYVGDAACADCHPDYAENFHHHPMGRSLLPAAQGYPVESYGRDAHNPFESLDFQFKVERRADHVVHKAQRLDAQGRVLVEADADIKYVIGSGTRGCSYLFEHDGYLFESPISWFTQKKAWDLSPSFDRIYPPERVVEVECLFCHANHAEAVENTRNRYRTPIFQGFTIGCERCHGPGELHVAERQRGEVVTGSADDSIVNPRHLSPELRESVCQQCHLHGKQRFVRAGRQPFDYRPGLPLGQSWAIFVGAPGFEEMNRAVGQVEQMYSSRCFVASNGKLGCISCHDPHTLPAANQRISFYRNRCLNCHQEQSCTLSVSARRQQNEDNCAACHMPRLGTLDIAHTALTDHRVLRRPEQAASPAPSRMPRPGESPLVSFYGKQLDNHHRSVNRDLGVALMNLAAKVVPLRRAVGPRAFPLLEKAVVDFPSDVVARESLAFGLSLQGKDEEALAVYNTILEQVPNRELTLYLASALAGQLGRASDALSFSERIVAVNPWIWEYRYNLARLLAQQQDWPRALPEAEAALRLNPSNEPTRVLLITCCLHTGQKDRAQREFQKLLALNPKEEQDLRSWFAQQKPQ
jgi:hypothetical protein